MRAAVLVLLVLGIMPFPIEGSDPPAKPDPRESKTQETPRRQFDLGLTRDLLDNPQNFSLFGLPQRPTAPTQPSDDPPTRLTHTLQSDGKDIPTPLDDLGKELAEREQLMNRAKQHLKQEENHLYDGSPAGGLASNPGLGLNPEKWVGLYNRLRNLFKKRPPIGASVPLGHGLTLVVKDIGDRFPEEIVVLPMTLGFVGNPIHANCNDAGNCPVFRLPTAATTLLVRGKGAGLVAIGANDRGAVVNLRPIGTLRFLPQNSDKKGGWRIRLTNADKGLQLPVIHWKNPSRGEWTTVPKTGLRLLVPAGDYVLEVSGPEGLSCGFEIEALADEATSVFLSPSVCQ